MTCRLQRLGTVAVLAMCAAGALAQSAPVSQPPAATQPAASEDVAVIVDGYPIPEKTVAEIVKARTPQDARDVPPATIQAVLRGQVLDQLIEGHLLDEQIARAGTKMTEEE
jgi:hypothetical protein